MMGVLGLAIPLGVIGSELDRAYIKHFTRFVDSIASMQLFIIYGYGWRHNNACMPLLVLRLMKASDNKQAQLVQDAISSADLVMKRKPTKDAVVAPATGECSKDEKTVDTSTSSVLRKTKSRRSSSLHPGSAASSQKTELTDCFSPPLRQDTSSFTGERRKSTAGKRSRESSSSKPFSVTDVSPSEQSRSLDGVRALVASAKESVHRAEAHLKAVRDLEREMCIVIGDATASASAPSQSSPGLSHLSSSIGGRWFTEEEGPKSPKHITPRRSPSANSISSAIESRLFLRKMYPEHSHATSTDEEEELET